MQSIVFTLQRQIDNNSYTVKKITITSNARQVDELDEENSNNPSLAAINHASHSHSSISVFESAAVLFFATTISSRRKPVLSKTECPVHIYFKGECTVNTHMIAHRYGHARQYQVFCPTPR